MEQILTTLLKYVVGILGVGFIVLLHEVGHFIAAHIFRIEVEVFSIGFGPKLVAKQIGNTEYRISLFLFGGYCKMKGADDLTRALDTKSKMFVHVEHGSLFATKPINKFFTYMAGPLTNFIVTIFLCTLLLSTSHNTLSSNAIVAPVDQYESLFSSATSPAGNSGIQINDKILKLNNKEVRDWQDFVDQLSKVEEPSVTALIERDGKQYLFLIDGQVTSDGSFRFGLTNIIEPKISMVRFLSPEYKAGLKKGDEILKVNDTKVNNNLDILSYFKDIASKEKISLTVLRDGEMLDIEYSPSLNSDKTIKHNFALSSPTRTIEGLPITKSLPQGFTMANNLFFRTISSLTNILKENKDPTEVRQVFTGPMRASLMIGNITILGLENSFKSGLRALCYLLAVVSISLAIANLLPLPAFDGGQMLIALLEIITRRKISPKNYWICQLIGMISVVLLFGFMYFIDFKYFFDVFMSGR